MGATSPQVETVLTYSHNLNFMGLTYEYGVPKNKFKGKLKRKCALRRATETRTVIAQKLLEIDISWW